MSRRMFLHLDTRTHHGGCFWGSSTHDPRGSCREMFANWPPKNSDLDPFTRVLKLHTRHMLGAETRTKIKGKMNT